MVTWERNSDWEITIVENMRTLIFTNILMTPQEKKVKLESKKHLISGLLEKTQKIATSNTLKSVINLATSLILLRKLLSESESGSPLYYNKDNVCHTIKELKVNNKLFKILGDMMKTITPLSAEAEVLDPLLLPLVERMTLSGENKQALEEEKNLEASDPEEDKHDGEGEDSNEDMLIDDSHIVEVDIEIEGDDEGEDVEDDEDDEGEEDEEPIEPFVEEIATQSEELSLDDMIENLEYDLEEGDESEMDDDEDEHNLHHEDHHSGDEPMDDVDEIEIEAHELDSDEASEMIDQIEDAAVMGFIEEHDDGDDFDSQDDGNPEEVDDGDEPDAFNVIEIEEHPDGHGGHNHPRRHMMEFQNFDDEDGIELESNDVGFHQLINMLHGRGRLRGANIMGEANRIGGANFMRNRNVADNRRRAFRNDQSRGLDSLYQLPGQQRGDIDNEFWESNINANPVSNNRNRANRLQDIPSGGRDPWSNFLSRDLQRIRDDLYEIRERIGDRNFGLNRRDRDRERDRERDAEKDNRLAKNPFEILRVLQNKDTLSAENTLDQVCESVTVEKRPSKEEIDKFNKEKEETDKKNKTEKDNLNIKKPKESKNEQDQTEIVERMDAMGLRRISEDHPQNEDDTNEQMQPSSPVKNEDNKEDNKESENKNQEDMQVEQEAVSSVPMQVEENNEEQKEEQKKSELQNNQTSEQNQPQSQPQPEQQNLSEDDLKINGLLEAFNVTREQVQNSGIDVEVLPFLPEFEVVSILSEIVSNQPAQNQQPEPQQQQQQPIPQQPESQQQLQQNQDQPENQNQEQPEVVQEENKEQNPHLQGVSQETNLPQSQPMTQDVLQPLVNLNQPTQSQENNPLPSLQFDINNQLSQASQPNQPLQPNQQIQSNQQNQPNQPNQQIQPPQNMQPMQPMQPMLPMQPNADQQMLSNFFNMLGNSNAPNSNFQPNPLPGTNSMMQSLEQALGMSIGMNAANNQPGGMNMAPPSNRPAQPQNPFGMGGMQMPPNPFTPPAISQQNANVPNQNQQNASNADNGQNEGNASQQPANANRNPNLPEGIDEEFFNSLPEECKQELLRDSEMLRRNLGQPPEPIVQADSANAEQMDTASFLATITDENLRRDILIGLDENTVATLPPRIQTEARRFQRDLHRRQFRREREEDNAGRLYRRALEGNRGEFMREMRHGRPGDNQNQQNERYDSFIDIIRRREEKYGYAKKENNASKPSSTIKTMNEAYDISKNTISAVFHDNKNLKNLLKIIIVESQRKKQMRFEKLIKPFENLIKNPVIRSKYNQSLMQILKYFKQFSHDFQYSHIRTHNVRVDEIFPPLFIVSNDTKSVDEIQYPKVALLVFKIFNIETSKYSANNADIAKSFFMKEEKKQHNQVQNWFTQIEGESMEVHFIEDSPFLCCLKYILSEEFYTNQSDMSEMLKIASNLVKKYLKPIKDKVIGVDNETLEVLFKLITLRVEQDFIKQICILFYNISLFKHQEIFGHMRKCILETIPEVEEQIHSEIEEKQKENKREAAFHKAIEEEEEKHASADIKVKDNEFEEMINTSSNISPIRPRLSTEGITSQQLVQESRDKSLALEKAPKLERLIKVFKMLLHQFSKHSRNSGLDEEEKSKGKFLKENGFKIIDIPELKGLFELFEKYLQMLKENEINDTVKMIGLSMFLCYQEDFKKIDQKVFNENFNKPNIVMQDYHMAENKQVSSFIDESYLKDNRISFFVELCTKNNKIFNTLIRQNQTLIRDSLKHMIYVVPEIFDFDNKHHFFRQEIKKMKRTGAYDAIRIAVNRTHIFRIFEESFEQMNGFSPEEWKGKLEITFANERGQDAGGLTREWFTEISKQMFNPNLGMFKLSDTGSTYYPNPKSYIQNEHLQYFRFIGRIIGKALLEEQYIECSFVKVLYKIIRGVPISWHDVEDYDNTYYNNLKWLLDNDAEILQQSFCETIDFFGKAEVHDLIEDGKNVAVTNENKKEYIQKVSFFKLYTSIKDQIDSFLKGFYELIPRKLISIFDHGELELLISGLPTIDIDDMKANSDYSGYNESSHAIKWFWEVLGELTNPEKAEFLQFVTGSSKVPIEGFSALQGMRGPHKFNIHKIYEGDFNRLPVAHTCFNQLDMPDYPNKELLRERLLFAIREGKGSFQIA